MSHTRTTGTMRFFFFDGTTNRFITEIKLPAEGVPTIPVDPQKLAEVVVLPMPQLTLAAALREAAGEADAVTNLLDKLKRKPMHKGQMLNVIDKDHDLYGAKVKVDELLEDGTPLFCDLAGNPTDLTVEQVSDRPVILDNK